jgi:hypothetical protein
MGCGVGWGGGGGVTASKIYLLSATSISCRIRTWSSWVRYSNPGGHPGIGAIAGVAAITTCGGKEEPVLQNSSL